jgi:hypothetical protein
MKRKLITVKMTKEFTFEAVFEIPDELNLDDDELQQEISINEFIDNALTIDYPYDSFIKMNGHGEEITTEDTNEKPTWRFIVTEYGITAEKI